MKRFVGLVVVAIVLVLLAAFPDFTHWARWLEMTKDASSLSGDFKNVLNALGVTVALIIAVFLLYGFSTPFAAACEYTKEHVYSWRKRLWHTQ